METRVNELSEKQLDELIERIVISIRKDREEERKQFKKYAEHNTSLLLRYYHKLKGHTNSVKEQLEADQDTFWNHNWLDLSALMQNKAKTVKLMDHVDYALEVYEKVCKNSDSSEERRRYQIIMRKYINENRQSDQEIADYFNKDRTTINRNCKEAIKDLSVILFGVDMLNYW
ncbi:hypothetical protein [Enterococcus malodoratus]|uniref:hypothetical protein n=1 Tax=Enterococcus malodoratus TaxID=71451 RepID=UPI0022DE98C7|nr:hypothetical protein [Enterococcus malodoratus]